MPREMKDSGIEWIGEIPSHWRTIRTKYILTANDGGVWGDDPKGDGTDKTVIRSTEQTIDGKWCIESPAQRDLSMVNLENSRIRVGDLLITKSSGSDLHIGKTTIADEYFESNECYFSNFIQRIRCNNFSQKLLWYLFNSNIVRMQCVYLQNSTSGIGNINADIIENLFLPMPPLSEQKAIADFLDKQCAEIDAVIAKTKATIEEYKKLKQSIITEAVTKGIRGDRAMKDSGIEWIGDIPADWEIRKLFRAIDKIGDIDHYMPESTDTGIPYLMTGDLKEKLSQVDFNVCKQVSFEDYEILSSKIKATQGDVIFARYATIGTVCIVDIDKEFLVSYSCLTIKPTKSLLRGNFLFYYLKSSAFFEDVKQYINSNTQANVGLDSMTKAKIVLPVLQEQREIVNYLDQKCAEIDTLIAKKTALLEEMETYKKSVIYEYVTGKKEVER